MDRNTNFLSELEAEFEAEFDSEQEPNNEYETDSEQDNEYELENEADDEYELDNETDSEYEANPEQDNEFELDNEADNEFEASYEPEGRSYESRLQQLLTHRGDNELEFDQELNQVIHAMEQEFFFKGLKRLARKGLRAFKAIAGRTPLGQVISTATSLARGNIRNALRRAAGLALRVGSGFVPGGALLGSSAARALNLEVATSQESPAAKARGLVQLAQRSYQNLAQRLDPKMMNPRNANSLAKAAMRQALTGLRQQSPLANGHSAGRRPGVVVHVSPAAWDRIRNGGSLIIKVR
jgi:hypothetical protein